MNPKADRLLKDLADLKLIAITPANKNAFLNVVENLRTKANTAKPPTLEQITKEVEVVRTKRYGKNKA